MENMKDVSIVRRLTSLSGGVIGKLESHELARVFLLIIENPNEVDGALNASVEGDAAEQFKALLNSTAFVQRHEFTDFVLLKQLDASEIVELVRGLRECDLSGIKQELFGSFFQGNIGNIDFPLDVFEAVIPDFKPLEGSKILIPYAENALTLTLSLAAKYTTCKFSLWYQEERSVDIVNFLFSNIENVGFENASPRNSQSSLAGYDHVVAFPPFGRKLSKRDIEGYSVPKGFSNPRSDSDLLVQRLVIEAGWNTQSIILVPELFMHSHGSFRELRDNLCANLRLIKLAQLSQGVLQPYTRASLVLLHFANRGIEPERDVELLRLDAVAAPREGGTPDSGNLSVKKGWVSAQSLKDSEVWNLATMYSQEPVSLSSTMETVELGAVVDEVFRGAPTESAEKASRKETLRVVGLTEMDSTILDADAIEPIEVGLKTPSKRYLLRDEDIVVTCRGTVTKVSLIKISVGGSTIPSSNVAVIRVAKEKLDPLFLLAFLMSDAGKEALEARQSAASQKTLSVSDLRTIQMPNLPLADQQKIGREFKDSVEWYQKEMCRIEKEYGDRIYKLNRMMGIETSK
jgi:hypothetical protein